MIAFTKWYLLILTTVLLAACASTPNTYSNFDPNVDFSRYKSFGYFQKLSTDRAEYESFLSNFLKAAVAQEFDARGLKHDQENPELLVNFYLNTQKKVDVRSVPTAFDYYGYRDPFYDPWLGYGVRETRVDQYTEGTLHIDVVDAMSKKLIWEGAVVGRVTDEHIRNLESTVNAAVSEIMLNFPVPAASAE
jgi:hypothetical protein